MALNSSMRVNLLIYFFGRLSFFLTENESERGYDERDKKTDNKGKCRKKSNEVNKINKRETNRKERGRRRSIVMTSSARVEVEIERRENACKHMTNRRTTLI